MKQMGMEDILKLACRIREDVNELVRLVSEHQDTFEKQQIFNSILAPRRVFVNDVVHATSAITGIDADRIAGKDRARDCTRARQMAMYLCHDTMQMSTRDIARKFSVDHSTVQYSIGRISTLIKKHDGVLHKSIREIKTIIDKMKGFKQ